MCLRGLNKLVSRMMLNEKERIKGEGSEIHHDLKEFSDNFLSHFPAPTHAVNPQRN